MILNKNTIKNVLFAILPSLFLASLIFSTPGYFREIKEKILNTTQIDRISLQSENPEDPWLTGWRYRRKITIDNTLSTTSLTDYQIPIFLNTAFLITTGKMRSDCGDIRITDSDGITLLNHWIEICTSTLATLSNVSATYASGTTCITDMNNFPSTPNSYGTNQWFSWDGWGGCDNCDWYVRINFNFSGTLNSAILRLQSDDGQTVWINGTTLGSAGGGCHAGGTPSKDWDIKNYILQGPNEIRIWCSEATGDENCYFGLIKINGIEITTNGDYLISTRVFAKIPSIPASSTKTIYVYYGNPSATSSSNATNTFDVYSNFQDGTLQGWQDAEKDTGSRGCVNDYPNASVDSTTGNPSPSAKKGPEQGTGYDCEVGISKTLNLPTGIGLAFKCDYRAYSEYSGSSVTNAFSKIYAGNSITGTALSGPIYFVAGGTTDTGWQNFFWYKFPNPSTTTVTIHLYTGDAWTNDWNKTVWFDNIFVSKLISPEPAVKVGNEESSFNIIIKGSTRLKGGLKLK